MKRLISILIAAFVMIGVTGCSLEDDTDIDMYGIYNNVLPEELKNVDIDNLTQEQLLEIIDNISVDQDIQQFESYFGFSFMDFMKQVAENPIDVDSILEEKQSNYMTFKEAADVLKEYKFDISKLDLEHPDEMSIDDITQAVTGYSIKKGFESWGPAGVEIYNTMEKMYSDIVDDTKKSFNDGMDAIKSAIGKKTDKDKSEITTEDILAYIQSELIKQGYDEEGSSKVIEDTLKIIADEMDGDQKKALNIFIKAAGGMMGVDTDTKDEEITAEEEQKAKDILNNMLDNVSSELTPEQQEVLELFKEVSKQLATYDYKSGNGQDFVDNILNAVGKSMNMTKEQLELIEIFKGMI